jgi:hypothetical protein
MLTDRKAPTTGEKVSSSRISISAIVAPAERAKMPRSFHGVVITNTVTIAGASAIAAARLNLADNLFWVSPSCEMHSAAMRDANNDGTSHHWIAV